MNKKILATTSLLLIIFCLVLGNLLFNQNSSHTNGENSQSEHKVTLTRQGFSPKEITIERDDSVTFVTTDNTHFWPASDTHPTHERYSEFDPGNPIDPDKKWTYRFTKVGRWSYHDHLAPNNTGIIVVL